MSDGAEIHDSVRAWFAQMGGYVAGLDFASARDLFADEVVSFGTFKDVVQGLDNVEAGQWRSIWPAIRDFAFNLDSLEVIASSDGNSATGVITWDSRGFDESGEPFPRPGRATVVLQRAQAGAPWKAMHTHFSVFPAERKTTFGDRSP